MYGKKKKRTNPILSDWSRAGGWGCTAPWDLLTSPHITQAVSRGTTTGSSLQSPILPKTTLHQSRQNGLGGTYVADGFDDLEVLHVLVPLGPAPAGHRLYALPDILGAGRQDPLSPVPAAGRNETKIRCSRRPGPEHPPGCDPSSRHFRKRMRGVGHTHTLPANSTEGLQETETSLCGEEKLSAATQGQPLAPPQPLLPQTLHRPRPARSPRAGSPPSRRGPADRAPSSRPPPQRAPRSP